MEGNGNTGPPIGEPSQNVVGTSPAERTSSDQNTATPLLSTTTPNARSSLTGRTLYDELLNRPRSNPRSRTPMRYESPLDPDAFRRSSVLHEEEEQRHQSVPPRQSSVERRRQLGRINLMAGTAVGTIHPVFEAGRPREPRTSSRSSKQGPSRRKVQRWNNDNFRHLAAEISAAGGKASVAEILLQAHTDAHLYRSVYDGPKDCALLTDFYQNDSYKSVRKEFFQGEIGVPTTCSKRNQHTNKTSSSSLSLTPTQMMNRVHARLKKVIRRLHAPSQTSSCSSSESAIDGLERFVIKTLVGSETEQTAGNQPTLDWKEAGLTQTPTVLKLNKKNGHKNNAMIQFEFKKNAGLSRLFLHAICQFHGLQVTSTSSFEHNKTKGLIVTGKVQGHEYRFLDHIYSDGKDQEDILDNDIKARSVDMSTAALESLTNAMDKVSVS